MSRKIANYMVKAMDYSKRAVFAFKKHSNKPFLANSTASTLFANAQGIIDIARIFSSIDISDYWKTNVAEQLEKEGCVTIYDLSVLTNQDKTKVSDVQLGFADDEHKIIFAEFFFKEDNRMEKAISQVNLSSRAEGIFDFDAPLTMVHCNDSFYKVFETNAELVKKEYNNQLSKGFAPQIAEKLLAEIHESLSKYPSFFKKIKIITSKGEEKWYSLELQRRTLDHSGCDKLMAYLVNIEKQVETENELDSVSQYFEILQSMSKGLLYRFDIHNRTLYRNETTAKLYNIPLKQENFPTQEWLDHIMHPDDIEDFIRYIDLVVTGQEASHTSRFKNAEEILEYHTFTFSPVYQKDGSIKEMIGCAVNIQEKYDLENTAKNVKKQFDILERVCEDRLSFIDFKTRVIIHNERHAEEMGIDMVEEHFPESIIPRVHPDDLESFKLFAESNLQGIEGSFTFRMLVNESDYEWFEVTSYTVTDEKGVPEQIVSRVKNVHHLQELQSKVADFNKQLDIIEKVTQESIFQVDLSTKILVHRGNHASQLGIDRTEENFPHCVYPRVHPDDLDNFIKYTDSVLDSNEGNFTFRMKVQGQPCEYEWFEVSSYIINDNNGKPEQIVGTVQNVHSHQEMIKRATTDMLTHCLNKMAMLEQVSAILTSSSHSEKHALLFLDLDDFKYVNDHFGHAFGDVLLQTLGKRLSENVRSKDLIGRVGGDEFIIFLRDVPNSTMLMGKSKMLLTTMSEEVKDGDKRHSIQGSIGIALYPDHGFSYEELYHHADIALYRSKHKGKNQVTMYVENMGDDK